MKLTFKVTPHAAQNKIGKCEVNLLGEETIRIYVTAAPEKGKANKAVIDLLSKEMGIAKSNFTVIRGELSTLKVIEINESDEMINRWKDGLTA